MNPIPIIISNLNKKEIKIKSEYDERVNVFRIEVKLKKIHKTKQK